MTSTPEFQLPLPADNTLIATFPQVVRQQSQALEDNLPPAIRGIVDNKLDAFTPGLIRNHGPFTGDLNTAQAVGTYEVTTATAANLPIGIVGTLEVMRQGANTIQRYTTLEDSARIYTRVHRTSSSTWSAWHEHTATFRMHGSSGTADVNTLTTPGLYDPASTAANLPTAARGSLTVERVAPALVQTFKTWGLPVRVWVRRLSGSTWSPWTRLAGTDETDALTARMNALENQATQTTISRRLVAHGDSITEARGQADPYVKILGEALGWPYVNLGWHGASTQNIAMRQGGHPTLVRFPGNVLPGGTAPVDTAQAVSFENPAFPLRSGNTVETVPGMILGVKGALSYDGRPGTVVWTRATAGEPVTVQGDAPFYPDQGETYRNDIQLIWTGHNNSGNYTPEKITDLIGAMIEHTAHPLGRFLVLQNLAGPGQADPAPRNWLAAQRWPGNYVPVADYLRSEAAATFLGHTLTTQDRADIAAGYTPTAYRTDALHLNSLGRRAVAERVRQFIVAKGWA